MAAESSLMELIKVLAEQTFRREAAEAVHVTWEAIRARLSAAEPLNALMVGDYRLDGVSAGTVALRCPRCAWAPTIGRVFGDGDVAVPDNLASIIDAAMSHECTEVRTSHLFGHNWCEICGCQPRLHLRLRRGAALRCAGCGRVCG